MLLVIWCVVECSVKTGMLEQLLDIPTAQLLIDMSADMSSYYQVSVLYNLIALSVHRQWCAYIYIMYPIPTLSVTMVVITPETNAQLFS